MGYAGGQGVQSGEFLRNENAPFELQPFRDILSLQDDACRLSVISGQFGGAYADGMTDPVVSSVGHILLSRVFVCA